MNTYIKAFAFLVFLPAIMLGQNKFSYGLNLGGQISPLHIQNSSVPVAERGIYEVTEGQGKFEVGAYLQYEIGSNIFVRSGVHYQRASFWYAQGGYILPSQLTPTGEILEGDTDYYNFFNFSSIAIPIDVGYRIATKKPRIHLLIGGGVAFHTAFKENSDPQIREVGLGLRTIEGSPNTYDLARVSLNMFTGVELGLSNTFVLAIEPHLKYSPNNVTLAVFDAEVTTAFEPGLSIRFRRK